MKNLKKALSLVLASAMLVGMMVVGTGAVHSDVKDEHNVEAIAVVSALEIMGAGETFNPDGEITRGEMAVIMTKMLALDTKEFKGASNFVDAGWAADYIDACYANGIMAGVSATEFGTNIKLTTAQAALMMLKALGYYEVKTLPANWDLAVVEIIRAASKDESNVLEGIDAKAYGNMTRSEVAKMILNTLYIPMVEESLKDGATGSTTVKGEGFEVIIGGNNDVETKTLETLLVDEFDIYFEDTTTALGMPATTWYMINEDEDEDDEIITVADAVKAVAVYEDQDDAKDLYKEKVDKKFKGEVNFDGELVEGDEVYFIVNEENDKNLDAYVVRYELAEVEKISSKTNKKGETTVKLNDVVVADGVEINVEKGDWALIAVVDGKVAAVKAAEIVEGKVTSTKAEKITLAGKKYEAVEGVELKIGTEYVVALNNAGKIAVIIDSTTVYSDEYAYIYNITVAEGDDEENEDGIVSTEDDVTYVYVVLADGSKAKYALAEDVEVEAETVVPYTINKDGEFEVAVAKNENVVAEKFEGLTLDKKDQAENGIYATSKTEFVFVSWKENDEGEIVKLNPVTTNTGVKNVEIESDAWVVYDAEEEEMITVFVMSKDEGLTVDADIEYAILVDADAEVTEGDEDDEFVYTYTVFAGGKEIELSFYNEELDVEENTVFAYIMDGKYATLTDDEDAAVESELVSVVIEHIGEDFIKFEGDATYYTVAEDAEIYVISKTIEEGEDDIWEFDEGELTEDIEGEILVLVNDDDEIVLAFYNEVIDMDAE